MDDRSGARCGRTHHLCPALAAGHREIVASPDSSCGGLDWASSRVGCELLAKHYGHLHIPVSALPGATASIR